MKFKNIVLAVAAITTGLIAGLFFGYQVSVIPAFRTLSDVNYIAAMQAINIAIPQDPFFEFSFLGAAVFFYDGNLSLMVNVLPSEQVLPSDVSTGQNSLSKPLPIWGKSLEEWKEQRGLHPFDMSPAHTGLQPSADKSSEHLAVQFAVS